MSKINFENMTRDEYESWVSSLTNVSEEKKEIFKRKTGLSTVLLREKAKFLEGQDELLLERHASLYDREQLLTCPELDTQEYRDLIKKLDANTSEYRETLQQIAASLFGHLTLAQIGAMWDSCDLAGRQEIIKDLARGSMIEGTAAEYALDYCLESGATWANIGAEVTGEFEKFCKK